MDTFAQDKTCNCCIWADSGQELKSCCSPSTQISLFFKKKMSYVTVRNSAWSRRLFRLPMDPFSVVLPISGRQECHRLALYSELELTFI